MMNLFNKEKEIVLKEMKTSINGLSTAESNARIEEYGENKLSEKKKKSAILVSQCYIFAFYYCVCFFYCCRLAC